MEIKRERKTTLKNNRVSATSLELESYKKWG